MSEGYQLNFVNDFLVDEGREGLNVTKSGPSLARQRYAIKMAYRWCANDSPTLNAALEAFTGNPDQYC